MAPARRPESDAIAAPKAVMIAPGLQGRVLLSRHPLIDLAGERDVKQAKGFREAAARLTGKELAERYQQELANAPRRHDVEKRYLGVHPGKPPAGRKPGRDEEHLAWAIARHCRDAKCTLSLPRGAGELAVVDHQVPLQTASPDKEKGDQDPNKGLGAIDLLGVGPGEILAVGRLKYVEPDARRTGTGDTPLRQLLEGLAFTAAAEANRDAIQAELGENGSERTLSEDPPCLLLMASPRYWQLSRKREAQKGAAWIKEMERLAREIGEEIGVQVFYVSLELDRQPAWEYDEEGPRLRAVLALDPAWERNAGRVRPKAASRPRSSSPAEEVVEADLSRPVRDYGTSESYAAGDRIQHPTLGLGVVQGPAGMGKIVVLFEGKKSVLVHERPAR
jgi:hypothetical protein